MGGDSTAGTAMEVDDGLSGGVSGLLIVDGVDGGDLEESLVVRFKFWVEGWRFWHFGCWSLVGW